MTTALPTIAMAVGGALGGQVENPARRAYRGDVVPDSQRVARANVHDRQQDAVALDHR